MWVTVILSALVMCSGVLTLRSREGYTRTVSYNNEIVVTCPDRAKATVQVLMKHADVLHMGQESVDLRINKETFTSVQRYFPECEILVQDFEAYMQEAERLMFPQQRVEEEAWMQAVVEEMVPSNDLEACERVFAQWEKAHMSSTTWFEEYHNYESIKNWYRHLANEHSDIVRYETSIGQSVEGRDMPAVHITANHNPGRKKIYLQCQIHAREWISGAACMYITSHLVSEYGTSNNTLVTSLLDNLEFVVVPFVNPDGYVYTWTQNRMWRKNRRLTRNSGNSGNSGNADCYGVDINRNFPTGWQLSGHDVRGMQCAEDYSGPYPLSEPETRNIVNFFRRNSPTIGVIDWHSYGELILRPWGYTNQTSPDETRLRTLSQEMRQLIGRVHNKHYTAETSFQLYQCFGIGSDWFYSDDAAGTNGGYRPASYCIELRGTEGDSYGFMLPANQIVPTSQEVLPAALHFAKSMMDNPIMYSGGTSERV